jgi:hypothetical protein
MSTASTLTNSIKGEIASLKALVGVNSNKAKLPITSNNSVMGNLIDIFNQVGGYNEFISVIENILVKNIKEIELTIKSTIKIALKQTISCGIEPTIDNSLTVTGVTFELKKIDPQSILSIDPQSSNGGLIYFDNDNGLNSEDFDVFLYTVIKQSIDTNTQTFYPWKNLFSIAFKEYDNASKKSNLLTIKINSSYNGKKLNSFISDYIDSIQLFDNVNLISSIFDDIMGTKIYSQYKTKDQLLAEKIINDLIDKILNNVNDGDVLDESFYAFSNDDYNSMLETSELKHIGAFNYNGDEAQNISVDENIVTDSLTGLKSVDPSKISEQTKIITQTINNAVNSVVSKSQIKDQDAFALKMDFIQKIVTKIANATTISIFTPKIITIFELTNKLLVGEESESVNAVDFTKANINVFKKIIVKIRDIISTEITNKIKEMLQPLIDGVVKILLKEQMANYTNIMGGLTKLINSTV